MCQMLNTGESNNFYIGIFKCIGPLTIQLQWKEQRIDRDGRLLCPPTPQGMEPEEEEEKNMCFS